MNTHPIQQTIVGIATLACDTGPDIVVGRRGVTRIEACEKPGEYAMIPYVRVWADDKCLSEFSQHSLQGLWFE